MDLKTWWFNNGDLLIKRVKAFAWHLGCVMAISGAGWILQQVSGWNIPDITVLGLVLPTKTVIGLVLAQVTKWLNNHTDIFGGRQK